MRCSFLHNIEQRHSVFARDCVEKKRAWKHLLDNGLLRKMKGYLSLTVRKFTEYERNNDECSYPFSPNIGVKYHVIPHRGLDHPYYLEKFISCFRCFWWKFSV